MLRPNEFKNEDRERNSDIDQEAFKRMPLKVRAFHTDSAARNLQRDSCL
jgi:hypothetical protein